LLSKDDTSVLYNTKSKDQVELPKTAKGKKPVVTKKKGAQGGNAKKKIKQEIKEEFVKKEDKSKVKVCCTTI
jgi:hypothetical protein